MSNSNKLQFAIGDLVRHRVGPKKEPVEGMIVGIKTSPNGSVFEVQWTAHSGMPDKCETHFAIELVKAPIQ